MSTPPKPTYELTISIGACDWDDLTRRLTEEANRIAQHGPACKAVWGGAGTHGHVEIVHRPDVTRESYDAELHAWWESGKRSEDSPDAK